MLKNLKIKNVALIEIIEINFEKGLNVFTGESGSGKSLILDSLNTLFGGTNIPPQHLIRPGEQECLIEAVFTNSTKIQNWFRENNIKNDFNELKVKRISNRKNKKMLTKYQINNSYVNKRVMNSLGLVLLEFAGQNDSLLFSSQDNQRMIIDELGQADLHKINRKVTKIFQKIKILKQDIQVISSQRQKDIERHFASLKILQILEEADLNNKDEINDLKAEEIKLANNVELNSAVKEVLSKFDNYGSEVLTVDSLINESIKKLTKISKYDSTINDFSEKLIKIQEQINYLICNLHDYLNSIDNREDRLATIQKRLYDLQNLEKTFSLELPYLIQKRNELRQVVSPQNNEQNINDLKIELEKLSTSLLDLANIQSSKRKNIAKNLENNIISTLKILGLHNASFKINFDLKELSENGHDNISFLFSANPDQDLAPLNKIISGGEMSRFLLALKANLLSNSATLFLDEIDSGLSGNSLKFLITLIKRISNKQQIFCITHQPSLAACADTHFKVTKQFYNGLTHTVLKVLNTKKQRQNELVEMIGGGFDEASEYALCLIDKAAA